MGYCCVMIEDGVLRDYVISALELAGISCCADRPGEASVICCSDEGIPPVPEGCAVLVLYRRPRYTRSPAYTALSESRECRALERPFLLDELIRNVSELLKPGERAAEIRGGARESAVILRRDGMTAEYDGVTVRLTEREFRLLEVLAEKSGATVSREVILRDAWDGMESRGNVVDVYVGYLRRKLEPILGRGAILAVRGAGYVLSAGEKKLQIR